MKKLFIEVKLVKLDSHKFNNNFKNILYIAL